MAFLFDTNIFITSKNAMPEELWPTFWEKLILILRSGQVFASTKVREELTHGHDDLAKWIEENAPKDFYIPIDEEVIAKYQIAQNWANNNGIYNQAALQNFAESADAYIIATASAKDLVLVTYEISSPLKKSIVKIPDVCNGIGVKHCRDFNAVLKELQITI